VQSLEFLKRLNEINLTAIAVRREANMANEYIHGNTVKKINEQPNEKKRPLPCAGASKEK
jgi:hypothetical protein